MTASRVAAQRCARSTATVQGEAGTGAAAVGVAGVVVAAAVVAGVVQVARSSSGNRHTQYDSIERH